MNPDLDIAFLATVCCALFLGGIVKGVTGAGTPVVAVPVIAAFTDVRVAVIIMVLPNLMTNLWQLWQFRSSHLPERFTPRFALAGAIGAIIGTILLALLPVRLLSGVLALAISGYVLLRILRPGYRLDFAAALKIAPYMGFCGGVLQGAAGISAPIAVSFLNAMRLDRPNFIATISAFFNSMSLVQIASIATLGMFTRELVLYSLLAILPLLIALPIGSWMGQRLSAAAFDKALVLLLMVLAARLIYTTYS